MSCQIENTNKDSLFFKPYTAYEYLPVKYDTSTKKSVNSQNDQIEFLEKLVEDLSNKNIELRKIIQKQGVAEEREQCHPQLVYPDLDADHPQNAYMCSVCHAYLSEFWNYCGMCGRKIVKKL